MKKRVAIALLNLRASPQSNDSQWLGLMAYRCICSVSCLRGKPRAFNSNMVELTQSPFHQHLRFYVLDIG
jgi:hypothetical protein